MFILTTCMIIYVHYVTLLCWPSKVKPSVLCLWTQCVCARDFAEEYWSDLHSIIHIRPCDFKFKVDTIRLSESERHGIGPKYKIRTRPNTYCYNIFEFGIDWNWITLSAKKGVLQVAQEYSFPDKEFSKYVGLCEMQCSFQNVEIYSTYTTDLHIHTFVPLLVLLQNFQSLSVAIVLRDDMVLWHSTPKLDFNFKIPGVRNKD